MMSLMSHHMGVMATSNVLVVIVLYKEYHNYISVSNYCISKTPTLLSKHDKTTLTLAACCAVTNINNNVIPFWEPSVIWPHFILARNRCRPLLYQICTFILPFTVI